MNFTYDNTHHIPPPSSVYKMDLLNWKTCFFTEESLKTRMTPLSKEESVKYIQGLRKINKK